MFFSVEMPGERESSFLIWKRDASYGRVSAERIVEITSFYLNDESKNKGFVMRPVTQVTTARIQENPDSSFGRI